MDLGAEIAKGSFYKEEVKVGKITKQPKGERIMIKRLVLLCCILFLPTIAAAQGTTNYGDFWAGGQLGGVFTPSQDVTLTAPGIQITESIKTDPGFLAGGIIGYNFCMPYRQPWERYFGVALDFQWNQFNHPEQNFLFQEIGGNQFALAFLGRLQYPFMGSERFTRGRIVPFLMFGPAVVWTHSNFGNYGGGSETSTDFGIVAEVGVEFFVCPTVSIGPSFRYRHVFGPGFEVFQGLDVDTKLDQFTLLGRLAYHF
jgi:opacity protein-like surface antigen